MEPNRKGRQLASVTTRKTTSSAADSTSWPAGFLALYHERYGAMVRLARMLTGRNDVAEDLVQDCYLAVARRWSKIDNPSAYLRRAVVNASNSWLRSRRRLRPLSSRDELPEAPPEIDETWRELLRLTPRRRAAVVLRYWEGLNDREIAAILDCRPATVRSLIHRALSQLEEVLA